MQVSYRALRMGLNACKNWVVEPNPHFLHDDGGTSIAVGFALFKQIPAQGGRRNDDYVADTQPRNERVDNSQPWPQNIHD